MQLIVGLGGNLGDVGAAFAIAIRALAARFRVLGGSGLWRSAAVGPRQPDFLNAAVLLEADADPLRVLAACQLIEAVAGRDRAREEQWGPRPLDLDLLIADGIVVDAPVLTLPHPRLVERRFALLPAAELAPDWLHPRARRTIAALAAALDPALQRCERVGELRPGT